MYFGWPDSLFTDVISTPLANTGCDKIGFTFILFFYHGGWKILPLYPHINVCNVYLSLG